ncbi:VOC family protein [Sphingomonas sp. G-3-2-10]|uniref:VOC family protein n=1 Tax=Sphingomonas sp. G-3-2-10 TaxID=2728838 RepID=UPI00146ABF75|nr:VOC family protein [Sphingomonas sp. G-3-2-10]NML06916.1 VOC family protein [Sphingomonas sp. G-3-2-10]
MTTTIVQPQPATAPGIAYDGGLTCALGVASLDAAIEWYTGILGMTLLYRRDDIAWAELTTGVDRVNIGLSQNETVGGTGGATLTFGVTDIEAAKAALDAADVRQDGEIMEIPEMVKLLTFYDPDGNALMFYQDLSNAHEAA